MSPKIEFIERSHYSLWKTITFPEYSRPVDNFSIWICLSMFRVFCRSIKIRWGFILDVLIFLFSGSSSFSQMLSFYLTTQLFHSRHLDAKMNTWQWEEKWTIWWKWSEHNWSVLDVLNNKKNHIKTKPLAVKLSERFEIKILKKIIFKKWQKTKKKTTENWTFQSQVVNYTDRNRY